MPWINYHSHTHYCDGNHAPGNYILKAMELGLKAYGFSSHAPVNFKTEWCMKNDKIQMYLDEIAGLKEKYKSEIEIYLGLEIDYIPGIAGRMKQLFDRKLDFFIGSIHFVDSFFDGTHWNIDTSAELFESGLKNIFGGDFRKAAERFFDLNQQMIEEDKPDVIGHMDKIKMFNTNERYFRQRDKWYKDRVEYLLQIIKEKGTIVEVNTRGFYRYNQLDLYPSQWIIEMLAKKDIPIVLNSDSHKPEEIIAGFEYAVEKLKKARVKCLWALIDNRWQCFEYNQQGIVL